MYQRKYTGLESFLLKLIQGKQNFYNTECYNLIHFYETGISRLSSENYFLEQNIRESENSEEDNKLICGNISLINVYKLHKNNYLDLLKTPFPVSYLK
jgi:hypothetical protein